MEWENCNELGHEHSIQTVGRELSLSSWLFIYFSFCEVTFRENEAQMTNSRKHTRALIYCVPTIVWFEPWF